MFGCRLEKALACAGVDVDVLTRTVGVEDNDLIVVGYESSSFACGGGECLA